MQPMAVKKSRFFLPYMLYIVGFFTTSLLFFIRFSIGLWIEKSLRFLYLHKVHTR